MRRRKPSRVPQVALPHSGMGQGKNSHGANNGFLILQHNWNTNGRGLALRSQSFACLKWSTGVTRPIRVCYQRSLLRSWVEKEACRDTLGRRNPLPDFPPHNSNLGGKPRFTRQSWDCMQNECLNLRAQIPSCKCPTHDLHLSALLYWNCGDINICTNAQNLVSSC